MKFDDVNIEFDTTYDYIKNKVINKYPELNFSEDEVSEIVAYLLDRLDDFDSNPWEDSPSAVVLHKMIKSIRKIYFIHFRDYMVKIEDIEDLVGHHIEDFFDLDSDFIQDILDGHSLSLITLDATYLIVLDDNNY